MGGNSQGGGSVFSFAEVTFPTNPGILVGLGIFTDGNSWTNFETWITAGIKTTDLDGRSRYNQIVAGYITQENGLSWQGTYKIEAGEFFYMKIRGNTTYEYQLQDRRLTQHEPDALLTAGKNV